MKQKHAWLVQPKTQVLSALATVFILFLLLLPPIFDFISTDVPPQLIPSVPQKETEISGTITEIQTGLFIEDFPTFDVVNNKFVIDAILWFQFDPSSLSLETVEKFSFEKGTILYKSPPDTKMIGDDLFARYSVRISLSSTLDYTFFPLNDHRIFIVMSNDYVTPSEMRFEARESGFLISPDVYTQGWTPVDQVVRTGYSIAALDRFDVKRKIEHPRVIFSVDFAKAGLRKVLLILVPILLLFFLGLFSLLFDHSGSAGSILSLSVGSLSGLLAYRFVIEKLSPEVGYFTLTDYVYTVCLGIVFLLFLFNNYIVRQPYTMKIRKLKSGVFFFIEFVVVGMWYYLLYFWVR